MPGEVGVLVVDAEEEGVVTFVASTGQDAFLRAAT